MRIPLWAVYQVLGITDVNYLVGRHHLAVVDAPLAGTQPAEVAALLRNAAAALPAAQAQSGQPTNANAAAPGSAQVNIDNFAFAPKELTVKVGSTVDWTNKDDTPHTATSDAGAFASPIMDTDQNFHYTFQKPGRFPYHCKLHPTMTGVVVMQ